MNPLLQEALGAIIRWALALGAGYLVRAGVWTDAQASTYVAALTLAALALGWSLWQKYRTRLKLVSALASPAVLSEKQVERNIAMGTAAAVSTPKNERPELS